MIRRKYFNPKYVFKMYIRAINLSLLILCVIFTFALHSHYINIRHSVRIYETITLT